MRSIERSKQVPFHRVLFGLGIRFVGETTAKYLAEHFRTLDAVMHASREELVEADEVGGKIADAVLDYFADEENLRIIGRLRDAGLRFEAEARERFSETLAGKSFVISGKFRDHTRDELKALIEGHGGRNLAAVSGNADYLVAGENMGPAKLRKAEKLGIRIISEAEFAALLDGDAPQTARDAASDEEPKKTATRRIPEYPKPPTARRPQRRLPPTPLPSRHPAPRRTRPGRASCSDRAAQAARNPQTDTYEPPITSL